MPKLITPLTDTQIKNIKAEDKPRKYFDGGGLFLHVYPGGGKLWQMDYRFDGKRRTFSFGAYPVVSLKDARESREGAKKLLKNNVDPNAHKQTVKAAAIAGSQNTFKALALEWYDKKNGAWAEEHAKRKLANLKHNVFPLIGDKPINNIAPVEVLNVLRKVEERGTLVTARRTLQIISQVFKYAVITGKAERNPAADLSSALMPVKKNNFPAITNPQEFGVLLNALDGYEGNGIIVKAALRLAPLVFVRPKELRHAKWADIDLKKAEWKFIVTKTKVEHLVPLAPKAIEILRELHPITGDGKYVFSGVRPGRPISNMTINRALQTLGYNTKTEHTGHGFRAAARTMLAEQLGFQPEVIEHQLAHKVPDVLGTAYNRTKYLAARKEMMERWADYLDMLKAQAQTKVIPLRVNEG